MVKVDLLNQYRMVVDVEPHGKHEEVFRTNKTLDQVKESGVFSGFGNVAENAKWKREGQGFFVYARVLESARGDMNMVRTFNKGKIGVEGAFTIGELEKYELVWVKGFGFVENDGDRERLRKEFELACEKK